MSQVRRRKSGKRSYRHQFTINGERFSKTFHTAKDRDLFKAELARRKQFGPLAGELLKRPPMTFDQLTKQWAENVAPTLGPRTVKDYHRLLRVYVLPFFGGKLLYEIDPLMVETFRAKLLREGRGESQTRQALIVVSAVMQAGKRWGYIDSNPVRDVKKPSVRRKTAVVCPSPRQLEAMRAVFMAQDRQNLATLVSVLGYLGLRPQEAFALEWRHIGEHAVLVEQKNLDGEIVAGQKTAREARSVPIPEPVKQDLAEWRAVSRTDLLFPAMRSKRAVRESDIQNVQRRHWKPVADDVAPGVTLYSLRHACASLHIHSGERSPAEVAQIMGHSLQTLFGRYSHVFAESVERVSVEDAIRAARGEGMEVMA